MMSTGKLRVIDAGTVGAYRSQSLWHGIASAMSADAAATLSLCRPGEAYVGLGFHRSLDELDLDACRRRRLPVIRRRIGGGPVYIDSDQLFFQITLPARRVPARVDELFRRLLAPAAAAFGVFGLDCRLRGINDLAVADRKLSGTGAGRIGEAVTVVGNVIFRFPHRRMVEVLALPDSRARAECLRLMERHVTSLEREGRGEVGFEEARKALVEAYACGLGLEPRPEELKAEEEAEIEGWEERFRDPDWHLGEGVPRGVKPPVKISAGVWVLAVSAPGENGEGDLSIRVSVVDGRIERMAILSSALNGIGEKMAAELEGAAAEAESIRRRLGSFGEAGVRVAELLAPGVDLCR